MIAVEILLEWSTHDGTEPVCGESTRQHTDISERTLKWLIEDVTDLILEILGCNQWIEQFASAFPESEVSNYPFKLSLPETSQELEFYVP